MPTLKSKKHELFAVGLAEGLSRTKAAEAAGYTISACASTGSTLAKKESVRARVKELQSRVSEGVITQAIRSSGISKAWVIDNLIQNIEDARAKGQFAVVHSCLVSIGKELHMFGEQRKDEGELWDGDLSTLTDSQMERITQQFERAVYGEDKARLERDKRRALRKAGLLPAGEAIPAGDMVIDAAAERGANADQNTGEDRRAGGEREGAAEG